MMVNTQYHPISIRVESRFELLHEFLPTKVKQLVNVPKTYLERDTHRMRLSTIKSVQEEVQRKKEEAGFGKTPENH